MFILILSEILSSVELRVVEFQRQLQRLRKDLLDKFSFKAALSSWDDIAQ